jgi:VWFA-related protein
MAIAATIVLTLTVAASPQQSPPATSRRDTEIQKLQEAITVERIIVDARVTLSNGEPVWGLTPKDFLVRVDGMPAKVESADWIPETALAREIADIDKPEVTVNRSLDVPAPQGRLLIFFFQTDFARNELRTGGQMKIMSYADQIIDSLEPEDRVAVFSFDSHLKFRLDFSNEKEKVRQAMRESLAIDEPAPPPIVPMPSLARRLDRQAMKDAASSERALFLLGNALRPIPGPKSLVLFGWGLGKLAGGRIVMGVDYALAKRSLESSRVSVFSIDITQADAHSLQVGLGKVSADTGGFYQSSFPFPQLAVDRLQRTLQGHYELEVRKPQSTKLGVHTVDVRVAKRDAVVLARTTYVDKGE